MSKTQIAQPSKVSDGNGDNRSRTTTREKESHMKTHTLRNSFHGTEIKIRSLLHDPAEAWAEIANRETPKQVRQYQEIKKKLCGGAGCICGLIR